MLNLPLHCMVIMNENHREMKNLNERYLTPCNK